MPAPSQLSIATSSLQRLSKEEQSYYAELQNQQRSIARLEASSTADDETDEDAGNYEFRLKQERKALEETKAVFPGLQERILSAKENLESLLESQEPQDGKESEEVFRARKVLAETQNVA